MITSRLSPIIRNYLRKIDWRLLLFLVIFLNVKLVVKLAALLIIYILRPNFKFDFRFKSSRLPLFYVVAMIIATFDWLLRRDFAGIKENVSFMVGIAGWMACILAIHQIKLSIDSYDAETLHNTILSFFILNAIVSLGNYLHMVIGSGELNPYIFQGQFQKYFINTGDNIRGISFDTSTTNAVLDAIGVVYFLHRRRIMIMLLCMIVLLLTTSNYFNFLITAVLVYLFIFQTDRIQKSLVVVCLALLLVFMVKISPQNSVYTLDEIQTVFNKSSNSPVANVVPVKERPDSLLNAEERKQKIAELYVDSLSRQYSDRRKGGYRSRITLPPIRSFEPNLHSAAFQRRKDTTREQKRLRIAAMATKADSIVKRVERTDDHLPGKGVAFRQTVNFLKVHPGKILTGVGMGNFSSKLAFRKTGLGIAGGYPKRFTYINQEFEQNHLAVLLYYFSRDIQLHSVVNTPNSVYDQLISEYGFLGLVAFCFFYIGFFLKRIHKNSIVIPLILLMLGAFVVDYWFEQFSVVIVFELLILLHLKETNSPQNTIKPSDGNQGNRPDAGLSN